MGPSRGSQERLRICFQHSAPDLSDLRNAGKTSTSAAIVSRSPHWEYKSRLGPVLILRNRSFLDRRDLRRRMLAYHHHCCVCNKPIVCSDCILPPQKCKVRLRDSAAE